MLLFAEAIQAFPASAKIAPVTCRLLSSARLGRRRAGKRLLEARARFDAQARGIGRNSRGCSRGPRGSFDDSAFNDIPQGDGIRLRWTRPDMIAIRGDSTFPVRRASSRPANGQSGNP
jgi:hypothetical protein